MDTAELILAIIGGIGGLAGLAAFFRIRAQNQVDDATATEMIQKAAMALIQPLQDRLDELESELDDMRGWAERLVGQVEILGGEPVKFIRRKRKDMRS